MTVTWRKGLLDADLQAHIDAADPHTQYQKESEKDAANGYAGLNSASRTTVGVKTTDHVVIDDSAHGPVLKDSDGHYWLLQVTTGGAITTTDLGTSPP